MSRQQNNRIVDELLSGIAQGYSNEEYIADKVFPVVAVKKEGGKIRHFTKELFHYHAAKRGLGADSNVIVPGVGEPIPWALDEYDLALPVDYREEAEADDISIERSRTFELTEMMYLRREKTVADAVNTAANYTNSNTAAAGTKWDQAGSDPIADIEGMIDVTRSNIGRRPNNITIGYSAWRLAKNHAKVLDRLKITDNKVVTPELFASLFEIPKINVGRAIWVNPETGVQADVWPDNVIVHYTATGNFDQRSIRTPSFGYTLIKRAWPAIDTYMGMGSGGKVKYIRYTALEEALFHGNIAGYLLTDVKT